MAKHDFMRLTTSDVWFWADPHLNHWKLAKVYCKRPYASIEAHDDALIGNVNSMVAEDAWLFIVGDFTLNKGKVQEFRDRIKCQNVVLILGSHDKAPMQVYLRSFTKVCRYLELQCNTCKGVMDFILFHNPIERWERWHYGSVHCHGHCHGNLESPGQRRYDVGVDAQEYKPISANEIAKLAVKIEPRFK